jgi:hypothetical protein
METRPISTATMTGEPPTRQRFVERYLGGVAILLGG